jgi:adenylate cyclase
LIGPDANVGDVATEYEHKLLVRDDRWREAVTRSQRLSQTYLCNTAQVTVRVRLVDDNVAYLTIKGRQEGIGRPEFEYAIPVDDARDLIRLAADGHPIEKTRHTLGGRWEGWVVDEFAGENEGLILAELEVEGEDAAWEPPDWAGENVTNDRRYTNAVLFSSPYSSWRGSR